MCFATFVALVPSKRWVGFGLIADNIVQMGRYLAVQRA